MCCQSVELMPGQKRFFTDIQFFSTWGNNEQLSLFSRTRATTSYKNNSNDLFTGAYLNLTSSSGFGGTLLGRISSNNSGLDAGLHYFKGTKNLLIYALIAINMNNDLLYSWFSIVRYKIDLMKGWKTYSSLELFSAFTTDGLVTDVQRIRVGFEKQTYQFGIALNRNNFRNTNSDINPGIFVRMEF